MKRIYLSPKVIIACLHMEGIMTTGSLNGQVNPYKEGGDPNEGRPPTGFWDEPDEEEAEE